MFNETSSHMWGSWYLPMLLLKDRSLTLMNISSLMVLVRVCDSHLLWKNYPIWYDDLRCWYGHKWGKVP